MIKMVRLIFWFDNEEAGDGAEIETLGIYPKCYNAHEF